VEERAVILSNIGESAAMKVLEDRRKLENGPK
jgi:hypothetical protein